MFHMISKYFPNRNIKGNGTKGTTGTVTWTSEEILIWTPGHCGYNWRGLLSLLSLAIMSVRVSLSVSLSASLSEMSVLVDTACHGAHPGLLVSVSKIVHIYFYLPTYIFNRSTLKMKWFSFLIPWCSVARQQISIKYVACKQIMTSNFYSSRSLTTGKFNLHFVNLFHW